MTAAPNRPIFVIGCPRSGTTMFTLMLHAHSRIAMPPETKFVLDMFRRRAEFGDLTVRENRRRLARAITRDRGTQFRHLGLDRRKVNRAIINGPPTIGSATGAVFRAYAERFGKARWGDKRPSYFRNVGMIRALFPDAQFIHLVRDARDCVASLKHVPWALGGAAWSTAIWTHAIDMGLHNARALPAGSYYELTYEQLVSDPRTALTGVCAFLGEDLEEGMLHPHAIAHQVVPARQTWHVNTRTEVTAARVGRHGALLEPWELRLVDFVGGRRLSRLGYDTPASRPMPPPSALMTYWRYSATMRLGTRKDAIVDRRNARRDGPVADLGSG